MTAMLSHADHLTTSMLPIHNWKSLYERKETCENRTVCITSQVRRTELDVTLPIVSSLPRALAAMLARYRQGVDWLTVESRDRPWRKPALQFGERV